MAKKEEPEQEAPETPVQDEEPQSDGEAPSTFELQFPNAGKDES